MNSLVISAKVKGHTQDDGEAGGGIQPNLDLSDKSSILDAGAWQSYFNVSVPTEKKRAFRAHAEGAATTLQYNPKGTLLVTGGMDTTVKIWDTRSGAPLATLSASKQPIMGVFFSNDDQHILATGNDKIARVWSMRKGRVRHTLVGHSNKIYAGRALALSFALALVLAFALALALAFAPCARARARLLPLLFLTSPCIPSLS
jgi:WD40 repeat protein